LVLEQQIKALQVELAVRFQVHPMVAAAAAEQEQLETHQHLLALVESVAQVVQAVQVMLVQLEQQIVALAAEEFMADQQHRAQVVLELLYLNTQTLEQLLLAAD
jgi:Holliday junction resolvasome RuvABC endonuclease subunit